MTTRLSVDFRDVGVIFAADRGFNYGDGLFETLRVVGGTAPLWARHAARLDTGCERLRMPTPDLAAVHAEVLRLCAGLDDAVVRITYTRGVGERGYALPSVQRPTLVIAASPLALETGASRDGIAVRLCDTRLAIQPALAGLKHLNRLEQVLARAEWSDPAVAEGLLCDMEGHLVCATAANLFAVLDGELTTPPVDRCGVAGVARAEILSSTPVTVSRMSPAQVLGADEVFLTSAVRGILPVRAFGVRTWQPGPITRALQAHWAGLGLPLPYRAKDSDR
ncbi:aminodeoxychorismate lyase [Luteibacter aegosomatissinici]|uniref:aminodeoxychorismate lyase n=1 Tax=Luteibacter aegosomatissinici TaxID=2911539 RepID=UPI001FFB314C|nr:aminodeoxychorismate lyase [Luteibacter aegosomatissinici]UPG93093.1 aminodeoxychorismate lyase [Luteibacter aegosomatissinici]